MNASPIPVQLYGGPLDGVQLDVLLPGAADVALVKCRETGKIHAYVWADRTVKGGKRWVLKYERLVGKQGGAK